MSRIRSVHPGLFTDERFVILSSDSQIFWIGILTECDDQGAFEWNPVKLHLKLRGIKGGDVEPLLAELEAAGLIMSYEFDGRKYGLVRNFQRWQRPKKPNKIFEIPPQLLPFVTSGRLSSEPVPNHFPSGTKESPQMEEEGGRMEEKEESGGEEKEADPAPPAPVVARKKSSKKKSPEPYTETFEAFWKAYPTRDDDSKRDAFDAWSELNAEQQSTAMAAIEGYREKAKKPYILKVRKFLSDDCYQRYAPKPKPFDWRVPLLMARERDVWDSLNWGPWPHQPGCRVPPGMLLDTDGQGWLERDPSKIIDDQHYPRKRWCKLTP